MLVSKKSQVFDAVSMICHRHLVSVNLQKYPAVSVYPFQWRQFNSPPTTPSSFTLVNYLL